MPPRVSFSPFAGTQGTVLCVQLLFAFCQEHREPFPVFPLAPLKGMPFPGVVFGRIPAAPAGLPMAAIR